ncbi:MAG: redoxin domain-containing protein [Actinobacteria bacterium]|nr:redoxin domain-containing protein [Actinomycetota bacterium]
MRSRMWIAAIVSTTFVSLLAAGCSGSPQPDEASSSGASVPAVHRGQVAPDFTLPQATGTPITLSDLHGRPVLLYFSMGPG